VCVSTSEPIHRFPQHWFERLPLEIIPTCEVNGNGKMGTRPRFMDLYIYEAPIPVAAWSKAQFFGRSPAEIVVSNPTGGMDVLSVVSVLCCQVEVSATD
jgi:hypothetical protein